MFIELFVSIYNNWAADEENFCQAFSLIPLHEYYIMLNYWIHAEEKKTIFQALLKSSS